MAVPGSRLSRWQIPGLGDVGEKRPRHEAVHPHLGRERPGETGGHGMQPGFRRGVGNDVRRRRERPAAGHENDGAPIAFGHARADQRRQPEVALHVDRHNLVVERFADIRDVGVKRRHAGVVHQNVHVAKLLIGNRRQALHVLPTASVRADGQRPLAGARFDLRRQRLAIGDLATGDDDVRPRLGKRQHHLPPEPAAAAGDQGHLAGQVKNARYCMLIHRRSPRDRFRP